MDPRVKPEDDTHTYYGSPIRNSGLRQKSVEDDILVLYVTIT